MLFTNYYSLNSLRVFSFFFLSIYSISLSGQHSSLLKYSPKSDLYGNQFHDIALDDNGNLLIASDQGLTLFNGSTFRKIEIDISGERVIIVKIFKDEINRHWLVSITGRLFIYNNSRIEAYRYNQEITRIKRNNPYPPTFFYADSENRVKISFNGIGLVDISPIGKVSLQSSKKNKFYKTETVIVKSQECSFFTENFGNYIPYRDSVLVTLIIDNCSFFFKHSRFLSPYDFFDYDIYRDTVYLSIGHYFYRISKNYIQLIEEFDHQIIDFMIDSKYYYFGLHKGGLLIQPRDKNVKSKSKTLLSSSIITKILKDTRDGIWISTIESGLFYLPSLSTTYLDASNSILKNGVRYACMLGDSVLIGDKLGNLYSMDSNITPKLLDLNIFNNQKPIQGITKYKSKVYVNSDNEIALYDGGIKYIDISKTRSSKIKKIVSEDIHDFYIVGQNIWSIGKDDKLFPLFPEKKDLGYFNHLAKYNGNLWLGSDVGLYQYDSASSVLEYLPEIVHSSISCLLLLKSRYLLIGTHRAGLYSLDVVSRKCKKIDFGANNEFNNIRDMILDSNQNAWIASRSSILKLQLASNKENKYNYHFFSNNDGILNNIINSLIFFEKKLMLSTSNGLILLDTSSIFNNHSGLKIEISEILINGAPRILDSVYSLDHDLNNIQLLLDFVDLRYADLVKFEYKLNLLNGKWNILKGKELAFLELPNGQSYTLFLRGRNLVKNETSEIKKLVFHIAPPFWKKWWFISMEALLTLSIVTGVFIKRGNLEKTRSMREIEINTKMRELEMKALRSQMNPHFLFNALNSIYSMINSGDQGRAGEFLIRFSKLLRIVINQTMTIKVPLAEELKLLQIYVELEQMRFNDSFEFELSVDKTLDPKLLLVPSFIIQPFVENAIIHGLKRKKGDDKKLQLLIKDAGEKIECKVIDNGVGRAQAGLNKSETGDTNKSVAMSNSARRLEMVNMGKEDPAVAVELIDLLDELGNPEGTEVILRIVKEEIDPGQLQSTSPENTA